MTACGDAPSDTSTCRHATSLSGSPPGPMGVEPGRTTRARETVSPVVRAAVTARRRTAPVIRSVVHGPCLRRDRYGQAKLGGEPEAGRA